MMPECEICTATSTEHAYTINRFTCDFSIHRCTQCGHLYTWPRPSGEELEQMYGEAYFSDASGREGRQAYTYTDERKQKRAFAAVNSRRIRCILRTLHRKHGGGALFVDIGCSFGSLLDAAAAGGFTGAGMDISPYAVAHLADRSIHAVCGTPEQKALIPSPATVVSMIEVIEHLESPAQALHNIYDALLPGGLLVVQTANMAGRQAVRAGKDYHYLLPGHLHYFSRRNLIRLLRDCGFNRIRSYYPCEFGLIPKLQKSRAGFSRLRDYTQWIRIAVYHMKSKIHFKNFALTSGMVLYAIKD